MQLRFFTYLVLFLSAVTGHLSYAQDLWARVTPPRTANNATLYSLPGFSYQNCGQYPDACRAMAWPNRNERVRVLGAMDIVYQEGQPATRYYRVEYIHGGTIKTGYIERTFLEMPREPLICDDAPFAMYLASPEPIVREVLNNTLRGGIPILNDRSEFAPLCERIVTSEGTLGPWGHKAMAAMERAEEGYRSRANSSSSCFTDVIDYSSVCPNYRRLSAQQKQIFSAYIFASIAQAESSCNPNEQNSSGVNDLADGLFQLEYSREKRADAGRDRTLCSTRSSTNSQNLDFQFNCTASILRDIHCLGSTCINRVVYPTAAKRRACVEQSRNLVFESSYWHELQGVHSGGTDDNIAQHLRQFPGCR